MTAEQTSKIFGAEKNGYAIAVYEKDVEREIAIIIGGGEGGICFYLTEETAKQLADALIKELNK